MKQHLLILMYCISALTFAQTTWTGGGANTNWNNEDNWNTAAVPTAADHVIIPTGFTATINVAASALSLNVQGTAVLEINSNLISPTTNIGANASVNWSSGALGGPSTFTNLGTVNLINGSAKPIGLTDGNIVTFDNFGTINLLSTGDLWIREGELNNMENAIIDMRSDTGNITWSGGNSHILNNEGTIKRTTSNGEAQIHVLLNNTNIISVESGTLSFQNAIGKNLDDGIYNVFENAVFEWAHLVNVSGTLQGDIDGTLIINGNVAIEEMETTTFDFEVNGAINWQSGSFTGEGTLVNKNALNLTSNSSKSIGLNDGDAIMFNNEGALNFISGGDLWIRDGILNNQATGVIDMRADNGNITWSGGNSHVLNNLGLIMKSTSDGEAQIIALLNNENTINVESGTLSLQNVIGKNLNNGIYNVSVGANFDWDTEVAVSGTLTGVINGNLNINSDIAIDDSTFNFTGSGDINWNNGSIKGPGTFTNMNDVNLASNATKSIGFNDGNLVTFNNEGTLTFLTGGDLWIREGVLNNTETGIIDMRADNGNITWSGGNSHILNNEGIIKKTTSVGEAHIAVSLNNTATISVESGTLSFQNAIGKNLTGGTYDIFEDAILDWDAIVNISGTLQGDIDGTLNINSNWFIANEDSATFDFDLSGDINWTSSALIGEGTFNNTNIINLTTTSAKIIGDSNGDLITFNNEGTINIVSGGNLWIREGVLNNTVTGIIDMKADTGDITWSGGNSHILNNTGLIKKTTSSGEARIYVLVNNTGVISVENGILSFQDGIGKNLNGGTYNVFENAVFEWDNLVNLSGTLEGTIDGILNLNSFFNVDDGDTATFDFEQSGDINWNAGALYGEGTFVNKNNINLTTGSAKFIGNSNGDVATFNNEGVMNIISPGNLLIRDGVLNNTATGIIDMQADNGDISWSGGSTHILNNDGLLQKTTSSNVARIYTELNNSGVIDVISGELEITGSFPFINEENGVVKGISLLDLPATVDYTNNGIFSPGGDPGTLSVVGDFTSTSTSTFDVLINGPNANTEHDVLDIDGDADFSGSVMVTLGFNAAINDEFIIATTTGMINSCDLTSTTNAEFDGATYTFSVLCRNDNEVVLTVTNVLNVDSFELSSALKLFPNPAKEYLILDNSSSYLLIDATVIDITGKVIQQINLENMSNQKIIDISAYAKGTYFMKITSEQGGTVKRFIKQ